MAKLNLTVLPVGRIAFALRDYRQVIATTGVISDKVMIKLTASAPETPFASGRVWLLRLADGRTPHPSAAILDSRTLQSTPTSGARAGYDGAKRKKGSKVHLAVDTLGNLLALHVTPANEQDRDQVGQLAQAIQEVSNQEVTLAYVDQGYTGQNPAAAALEHGIALEVVKLPEAKRGFVLLPRRWVVERSFGWAARFRRLARDYERLPETLAGLHYLAFACLMLPHLADAMNIVQNML